MTMTDPTGVAEAAPEIKYGTAAVERTVSDGNYGSTKISVFMPFVYEPSDGAATEQNLADAILTAKAQVYAEHGLPSSVDSDGIMREIRDAFPGAVPVASTPAPQRAAHSPSPQAQAAVHGATPQGGGYGGGGQRPTSPYKVFKRLEQNGEKVPNPDWFDAQVAEANVKVGANETEFWDNRANLPDFGGDGNPRAPWFRGKNNRDVAVWPPR